METKGGVFYAPIYMMMFLEQKRLPETMVCDIGDPIDFSRAEALSPGSGRTPEAKVDASKGVSVKTKGVSVE